MDARSKTTNSTYDALNRPTTVTYPTASALNVAYVYDTAQADCQTGEAFTIGRLAKMTDGSGSTVYCYDRFGALVRKVQTTNGQSFTLRYAYAANGQLQKTIYPDNAEASYLYDAQGRTQEINVKTATGTTIQLLRSASYHPFGPVQQWTYGNGRIMTRTLNLNGEPGIVQVNATDGLSLGYEFDEVGNLKKLRNGNQSDPPLRLFGYDALSRLTETKDGGTNAVLQSYAYDATGNRTSATVGGTTTTNTYEAASHRMIQVGVWDRTYDNAGNTTYIAAPTGKTFVYGDHNRMTQALNGATVAMNYVYNGLGERVRKYLNTTNTYTMYDEAGRWIGDYGNAGGTAPTQQVIWFDDLPVGVLDGAGANQKLHYIEPDALGTPRVVIDRTRGAQGVAIWRWDLTGEAFGTTTPNQDPDGDATPFVFDMRFPGQRYDAASGLNYNYFRDYDPSIGRYTQSDPMGLAGGISTYGYVGSSPTSHVDRFGLARELATPLPFPDNIVVGQVVHTRFAEYVRSLGPGFGANDSYGGVFGNLRPDAYRYEGLGLPKLVWELKPISNMDNSDLYHNVALAQVNQYLALANREGRNVPRDCGGWKVGHGRDLFEDGKKFGRVDVYFLAIKRTYEIRLFHDTHPGNTGLVFYEATLIGEENRVTETLREAAEQMARQPPWWFTMPPISGPRRPGYP